MSAPPAENRPVFTPSPYFVNLPVDFLLIGGGSIILFLLLPFFQNGERTAQVITIGMWLTWVGNWPHFSATSYRLYSSTERLRQYPFTAIAAPILVAVGSVGCFAYPALVTPYFVKMFLVWSPYHYSGQTLGISLLYARRNNHRPDGTERLLLTAFIYGTFVSRTLRAETSLQGMPYYGIQVPGFGVPMWVASTANIATYVCGAAFLVVLLGACWRSRKPPPLMYLLPAITQYVWFYVAGARRGYSEFVPFFHGLQYLTIAWAMQLKEKADRSGVVPTRGFLFGESARWYLGNIIGGACLFHFLPLLASHETAVTVSFASAVILAAIQIHHFFVDGVIWKLRSRSVVSPLLVNIPDLIREDAIVPEARGVAA